MAGFTPYSEVLKIHPKLEGIIAEKSWNQIGIANDATLEKLSGLWKENIRKNIESKRFKRHGSLNRDCKEIGKNKAIICIGAGQSYNKNKHILKQIHDYDGLKPWPERDFIFIASNHMFKPLLKEKIIPDFVLLCDGSDVVTDQVTKDIPESGRNCVLIAGLQCSPKVMKRWEKQGRDIRFYLTGSEGVVEYYKELTGEDPLPIIMSQGGNVLNACWTIGLKFFKSSVYMTIGNDLSYPLEEKIEERRRAYYADGDYSSNAEGTGTGRDEARSLYIWLGFGLERTKIASLDTTKLYNVGLEPVCTNHNLWIYKTWIESHVLGNSGRFPFQYYNCSEGGIAGVLCKDDTKEGRDKIENWFLMDSVCKHWRTRMLEDAIQEFLTAKKAMKWGINLDARCATASVLKN